VKVAAWAYPIERVASWAAFEAKLARAFADAARAGAELCVVPEYASMELTSLAPDATTLADQVAAMQPLLAPYLAAYAALARAHALTIVGGSFPERLPTGEVRNRARVHLPDGRAIVVEKLQMTRFERERWDVVAGDPAAQVVVDTPSGARVGVAVCYDCEFPLLVRRLAAAGADVICVPSCTDAAAGYHRVAVACRARALENQCYVVQAPTVGDAPWSIAVDANTGAAGVFAPPDRGFPADGVVAIGTVDAPGWTVAELDLAAIAGVRADGAVLNYRDWDRDAHLAGAVRVESWPGTRT
jgi:predicted amidohydrolase